jgi:glycosyltransferase involved in cell wall biosynthesis
VHKIACIPAFNEEDKISELIEKSAKYVDQVVVCDDGSSDQTASRARSSGAYVIKHKKNLGKGAALQSLFLYAKDCNADVLVTIDGDGQFLPEEIPLLLNPIIKNNVDIVIGNRFKNSKQMPSYRKVGNSFLNKMTSLASDLSIKDTQSGFRAYSKHAISKISFLNNGFVADSEILVSASKNKLVIIETDVTVLYDTGGKTSTKNPISHTVEVVTSLLEIIVLKHPLTYLGIPGILFLIIGIVFSINVIIIFNNIGYFSIPNTLLAFGFLISGLMFILVSILMFGILRSGKNT